MASVQQLEKLYQIQRMFEVSDSLEATVARERIASLIARTEKLIHQRTYLRDERRRLRIQTEQIEERKRAMKIMQRGDWVPDALKPPIPPAGTTEEIEEPHKLINISGLMFEAPVSILIRDKGSLLAQLCSDQPPVLPDPTDGFFYFDTDWWLFRYVLAFLRDGSLPDDRTLLAQLYKEAGFWHLREMQIAIEEEKLHLRSKPLTAAPAGAAAVEPAWWRKLPTWWQAVDEAKKKQEEEDEKKKKKEDWWTDSTYKGKTFLPLSNAADKLTTKAGEKDAINPLKTTYTTLPGDGSGGGIVGGDGMFDPYYIHHDQQRSLTASQYRPTGWP